MPFLYIYSPSDFIGGIPDESGAQAAGSGPWTFQLAPGATPTLVEITDNDAVFDELDTSQSLTNAINLDGNSYSAGTSIHSAYDLINSTSGHKITSLHFGGDGYEQGAVHGIATTVPLVEGVVYTFDDERTSVNQTNLYTDFVACFVAGTLIRTRRGMIPVEDLERGDDIETATNGFQPLRLKLTRTVSLDELINQPNLRPVRIGAGALGPDLPKRDLMVSPQHRMQVTSPIAGRMFETDTVLVAATKLTRLNGISVQEPTDSVDYYHLVMDQHEVLFAEGAASESFYLGEFAIKAMAPEARAELLALFPHVLDRGFTPIAAHLIPSGRKQSALVERHEKNNKALAA